MENKDTKKRENKFQSKKEMVDLNHTKPGALPVLEMPDFYMEDGQNPKWLEHLSQRGVVVVKGVMTEAEVQTAVDKYWNYLDNNSKFMMKQKPKQWQEGEELVIKDQSTLHDKNWPVTRHGFSAKNYCNHSDAAWYMRTIPAVKKCYEQIYKTSEVLTSFDTIISWRQWWLSPLNENNGQYKWLPKTGGLHCDQNPNFKKGFHCIQGMLLLEDIDENIGGLEVVPDTNTDEMQEYLLKNNLKWRGDFSILPKYMLEEEIFKNKNKLVKGKAGDFILWDSRTIHGGKVGPGYQSAETCPLGKHQFARLAFTVCMAPKSKVENDELIEKRREAFELGIGTTHWPYEFIETNWGGWKDKDNANEENKLYKPVETTKEILDLIG